MIYRVGDGDNPAYDYTSQLKPAKNAESQERFSLEHQKEQEVPGKKEDKGEDKKLHQKPGASIRTQDGVKLELSGGRADEQAQAADKALTAGETGGGFLETVSAFLKNLFQAVGGFFYKVWNDSPQEAVSEDVTPEEAERYTEEYYAMKGISAPEPAATEEAEERLEEPADDSVKRDEKIRQNLRSGNIEQVISLLTEDGRKSVARNSTLLTYYDKNGKLTQLNASDKERILHGDRHVRTL